MWKEKQKGNVKRIDKENVPKIISDQKENRI